jgi:hypothetical protein
MLQKLPKPLEFLMKNINEDVAPNMKFVQSYFKAAFATSLRDTPYGANVIKKDGDFDVEALVMISPINATC